MRLRRRLLLLLGPRVLCRAAFYNERRIRLQHVLAVDVVIGARAVAGQWVESTRTEFCCATIRIFDRTRATCEGVNLDGDQPACAAEVRVSIPTAKALALVWRSATQRQCHQWEKPHCDEYRSSSIVATRLGGLSLREERLDIALRFLRALVVQEDELVRV